MDEKNIVARNLAHYRKTAGLTQQELADKLNYTDKAVSKWERGEAVPDVFVLKQIADLYNVKVDDFLKEEEIVEITTDKQIRRRNVKHLLVALLSVGVVWLVATIATVAAMIFFKANIAKYAYIWALPVSAIVLTVFSILWARLHHTAITVSLIVWTTCLGLQVSLPLEGAWGIYLVGAALQVLVVLWFLLQSVKKKINKQQKKD